MLSHRSRTNSVLHSYNSQVNSQRKAKNVNPMLESKKININMIQSESILSTEL